MEPIKAMLPQAHRGSIIESAHCKICHKSTRENKPYCSDHIENSEYVIRVMKQLEIRDAEERKLTINLYPGDQSVLVQEALCIISRGQISSSKLAKSLDISHESARTLADLMSARSLIEVNKTDRGKFLIRKKQEAQDAVISDLNAKQSEPILPDGNRTLDADEDDGDEIDDTAAYYSDDDDYDNDDEENYDD